MKNPKNLLIQDFQQVGNIGLPINNQAVYIPTAAFPNTNLLYGWRNGLPVQGGIALTKNGTIGQAVDNSGNTSECDFTGAGYYSSADSAFAFNGSFSVGVWVYRKDWAKSTSADQVMLSRYSNGSSSGWTFWIGSSSVSNDLNFTVNSTMTRLCNLAHLSSGWHFIAIARDAPYRLNAFIDGVRVASIYNASGLSITNAGNLEIGGFSTGVSRLTDVRLSDVWIHNGAIWTDAQVKAIYAASCPQATYNQKLAGHRVETVEAGQVASEVLAHYKFGADLTKDEKGSFPLTAVGTPSQAEDIFGNMGAVRFQGGGQAYTNANLLSTAPSKGWWISLWVKPELHDASDQTIFSKIGTSGLNYMFELRKQAATGMYTVIYGNGTQYIKALMTPFRIGRYDKFDVCWDSINGIRVFVNAVLELSDSSAISLPSLSTTYPLQIGRLFNGTAVNYFTGSICDLKVLDKVPTQKDIDMAYASTFVKPDGFKGADIVVRPSADSTRERREKIQCYVDNGVVYRQGMRQLYFDVTDKNLKKNSFKIYYDTSLGMSGDNKFIITNLVNTITGRFQYYYDKRVFTIQPHWMGCHNAFGNYSIGGYMGGCPYSGGYAEIGTTNAGTLTNMSHTITIDKQGPDYLPEGFVACNSHDLIQIRGEK